MTEDGHEHLEPEPELTAALRPPWWAWAALGVCITLDLKMLRDLMQARAFARATETFTGSSDPRLDAGGFVAWLEERLEQILEE